MYYQTMIKRLDDSIIDFSWVYCCKFKARSTTEDLTKAMREAIKEETIAYKKNQIILQCNICKSDSELYINYHVDHAFPSFRTLKNDFLNITSSIIPQTFGSCDKFYTTIFKENRGYPVRISTITQNIHGVDYFNAHGTTIPS